LSYLTLRSEYNVLLIIVFEDIGQVMVI